MGQPVPFDQAHLLLDVVCMHLAHIREVGQAAATAAHANTEQPAPSGLRRGWSVTKPHRNALRPVRS